jgi:hypothetical protein
MLLTRMDVVVDENMTTSWMKHIQMDKALFLDDIDHKYTIDHICAC